MDFGHTVLLFRKFECVCTLAIHFDTFILYIYKNTNTQIVLRTKSYVWVSVDYQQRYIREEKCKTFVFFLLLLQINLATHLQTLTKIYSLYNTEFPYGMWSCMHEGSNNKALKKRTLERMKKKEKKIREKRKNGELISVKNPSHFVKVACFLFFFLYIFLFIFFCFVDFYFRRTFIQSMCSI